MTVHALVPALALAAAGLGGCGLTSFDLEQELAEQRVDGSGIPAPLAALFPLPLHLDLSARIKERSTGPIDRVTLASLALTITATSQPPGDRDDWAFVERIRVFVRSARAGSALPRVEIAHAAAPGAVQVLDFDIVPGVDLAPYVDQGSVVETEARGTIPPDDVSFVGLAVFTVHVL